MHDLAAVDLIRDRLDVSYQAAMAALDQSGGDVVAALALLEPASCGLEALQEQIKEGVKRGLSGEQLHSIRWKLSGQTVGETPVRLEGLTAAFIDLLSILISSSTIETQYAAADDEVGDGDAISNSH
jgi:hypothetical protein